MAPADRELLLDAARRAEPREACGILTQERAHELPNRATARDETFHIYAEDMAAVAAAEGGWAGVRAVWHSHPDAYGPRPSATDVAHHPVAKVMIIVHRGELYFYGDDAEA